MTIHKEQNADYIVEFDDVLQEARIFGRWFSELDENGNDLPLDVVQVTPELQAKLDATGRTIFESMFAGQACEDQHADQEWNAIDAMYS